ncbi:hypothetical protein TH66_21005 [Carbonactinospora thermoautotrophica]|uniref:Uncharacterized protein n=1 Tax=Carbonactinospora thermoautotrophica TaxID=1469144 RepID=A0A132NB14_9ACTN|nr:hypothetical protein [Carbonactinospora thermoautotrophica]KWW97886.1 hypothetical protein TH66_21005 [Carbonactinospora thermoautotrophica]KWX07345.1 hypothetical protein TR74_19060 [Carbonactinospora thermoautotrophica]
MAKRLVFAVVTLLTAVIATPAARVDIHDQFTSSSRQIEPSAADQVEFVSDEDYEIRRRDVASSSSLATHRPNALAGTPWWHIRHATRDWNNRDIPTRQGNSNFGYQKTCGKHNMCSPRAIEAPYHGYPDETQGTRNVYYGYVLVNGRPRIKLKSVADTSQRTALGNTPDGRPVGTLTAYCMGMERCPDWVNSR